MNKVFIMIFFPVFCIRCLQQPANRIHISENINSPTLSSNEMAENAHSSSDTTNDDFNVFWKKFREAALTSDTAQLSNLCLFPIKYRGPLDDDSVVNVSDKNFYKVFGLFLKQWNGFNLEGKSELDFITKTTRPQDSIHKRQIHNGDMVFYKIRGSWKLGFLYLNSETITQLNK
jgi:hypothetical protein